MTYPSSLDELTDGVPSDGAAPTTALDNATYPHDDHHRALAVAVEAVEAELGTDPSGASATVAARITATETVANGAVAKSLVDAAGDLLVGSGADTVARLPMGTALQVLRVNAGATGLEYAAASGAPMLTSFVSGYWWSTPGTANTLNIAVNRAHAVPFVTSQAMTITRLGAEVTSGSSGALVRLGIYSDSSGLPGTVLLDAGTINGASATYQEITISQPLSANTKYWFVVANQGGGTVGVRGGTGGFSVPQTYALGPNEAGSLMQYTNTWSGALISPFPAPDDFRSVAPRFTIKVA